MQRFAGASRFTPRRKPTPNFVKSNYIRGSKPTRFEIFKHLILARVLKLTSEQRNSSWTYVDFSAGAGKLSVGGKSEALQTIYKHAREDFENKRLNAALPLIEAINKLNGVEGRYAQFTPPVQGEEPEFYPTGAALASLYLRPQDRAILLESDEMAFQELVDTYGSDRRFKLHCSRISTQEFNVHLPPINRKGVVYLDVHKSSQNIIDAAFRNKQKLTSIQLEEQLHYMAQLIVEACKVWPSATYVIPYSLAMLPHTEKRGPKPRNWNAPDTRKTYYSEVPVPPVKFINEIRRTGMQHILMMDMYMEDQEEGIGCMIINPPQGIDHEMNEALPLLKEMLSHHTSKEVWKRPKVVWPNADFDSFNTEEQERKISWSYINRIALSDAQIQEYEAQLVKSASDPALFDEFMNYDIDKRIDSLDNLNDVNVEELFTRKGDPTAKALYKSTMKSAMVGRTGGVVYPNPRRARAEAKDSTQEQVEEKV